MWDKILKILDYTPTIPRYPLFYADNALIFPPSTSSPAPLCSFFFGFSGSGPGTPPRAKVRDFYRPRSDTCDFY